MTIVSGSSVASALLLGLFAGPAMRAFGSGTIQDAIGVTDWYGQASAYKFHVAVVHVAVVSVTLEEKPQSIGDADGSVNSNGVMRLLFTDRGPAESLPTGDGGKAPAAPKSPIELYKFGETLVLKNPSGAWMSLTLHDCEPEVKESGKAQQISFFSEKLVAVVGGPSAPNVRAGTVQTFAFVRDPRAFVRQITSADELALMSGASDDLIVDVAGEQLQRYLGSAQISHGVVSIGLGPTKTVREMKVILESRGVKDSEGAAVPDWKVRHEYTAIEAARDFDVPKDVALLLKVSDGKK